MKIAFVWPFDKAKWILPYWRDGLRAAIEEIEKKHTVDWFIGPDIPDIPDSYDAILTWTDSNDAHILAFSSYKAKKGIFLTTDLGLNYDNLKHYDVVFAEAQPVVSACKSVGLNCYKAFATDTSFFKPERKPKLFDAFYPATFSPWKRQHLFAQAVGDRGLALGTVQPDGAEEYRACQEAGVRTIIGYLPYDFMRDLYNMSRVVMVTGYEGSGRTILEAMSCDVPVIVAGDNEKATSYVKEAGKGYIVAPRPEALSEAFEKALALKGEKVNTRPFVEAFYSPQEYAKTILKGLK